jgi:predicted transcriptional regulator
MGAKQKKLLTEVELELMGILWKMEEGAVSEILAHLPKGRKLAYTSVSTILRILEQKKVIASRKEGRGHVYYPILKKNQYEDVSLNHLVSRVFDGVPTSLVRRLIEAEKISDEDLKNIRLLIDERLQE